ncbi:MAG: hypothetical protein ACRCWQ_14385 [Bacilli bacterium]
MKVDVGVIILKEERKQVIIEEILFWKQNKLLPLEYCDYLFAFYSAGDEENVHKYRKVPPFVVLHTMIMLLFIPIFFVFLFTDSAPTSIELVSMSVMVLYAFTVMLFNLKMRGWFFHLGTTLGFFLLFLFTLHNYWDQILPQSLLFAIYTTQMVFWVAVGQKLRVSYLFWGGLLGAIAILIFGFLLK